MDRENHLHLFSGGSRGKPDLCPPSSLAIDFGTLQRRNKREILGNLLDYIGPQPNFCTRHCMYFPLFWTYSGYY